MTYTAAPPPGDFRIGQVLSRSFDLLFGDFVKFFAITIIVWAPIVLVSFFGGAYFALAARSPGSVNPGPLIAAAFGFIFVVIALSVLSEAVVLFGAFQKMRGRDFGIGQSFAQGFARFPPILGMFFVMGLAISFAAVLLIVPALILVTMWYVALPACVVERAGPIASLRRSSFLTSGRRWQIFGIYILLFIVNTIVQQVLGRILGPGIVGAIVSLLWLGFIGAYQAIVVAVIYHDLRVAKEGIDIDRIAAVFD